MPEKTIDTVSPFDNTSPADGFVQVQVSKYVFVDETLVLVPAEEGEVEVKFRLEPAQAWQRNAQRHPRTDR